MDITIDRPSGAEIRTLGDALAVGLELLERFGDDTDLCALAFVDHDGRVLHRLLVCTEVGDDTDRALTDAMTAAVPDGAWSIRLAGRCPLRLLLWRTAHDLEDGPSLSAAFFDRESLLADAGVVLVDEIVMNDEQLRSMAVTTFCDEDGWDDLSAQLADTPGGGWWPV